MKPSFLRNLQIMVCVIIITGLFGFKDKKTESQVQNPNEIQAKVILVNPEKAEKQSIAKIATEVKYVRLKVQKNVFFGGIRKALIRDSSIYILDILPGSKCRVFCFDMNGNFRYIIDKQGRGPGEYNFIYDISITGESLVLSVQGNKLMFYNRENGEYIKTREVPPEIFSMFIAMPDNNTVALASGRYKYNISHKQLKVYDLKKKKIIFEAVDYNFPALKLGQTYRHLYYFKDTLSFIPMYSQIIYRILIQSQKYAVKPAWKLDFGKYWIDEEILKNSYNKRDRFFNAGDNYVHTVDVFETDQLVYLYYRYKLKEYACIFNKESKQTVNISGFTANGIGWVGKPITTWNNYIVNVVTPFDAKEEKFTPCEKLQKEFSETDDEERPVLVFTKFNIR